jgi:hypothetical protein
MRRRSLFLAALGLLWALALLACRRAPNWKPYTSAPGRYTALFPAPPQESSRSVPSVAGPVDMQIASAELVLDRHETIFMVMYNDLPRALVGADPKTMLDGAVEGVAKKGTLVSENDIELEGRYPGREIVVAVVEDGDTMHLTDRVYVVNDRMYQELVSADPASAAKFLDSFTLTKSALTLGSAGR